MFVVDKNKLKFDKDGGIKNFQDVVDKYKIEKFMNLFLLELVNFCKEESQNNQHISKILILFWTQLFLKIFYFVNYEEKKKKVIHYKKIISLKKLIKAETDEIEKLLKKGPKKSGFFIKFIRRVKNLSSQTINTPNLSLKKIREINSEKNFFFSGISNEFIKFTKKKKKKFYYLHREDFFQNINVSFKLEKNQSIFVSKLVKKINEFFKFKMNYEIDFFEKEISDYFLKTIFYTNLHIKKILKDKSIIPKTFFVSSLSPIWTRIIANCIKLNDGEVVCLDHGSGSYLYDMTNSYYLHQDIDTFITYSKKLLEYYKKGQKKFFKRKLSYSTYKLNIKNKNSIEKTMIVPFGIDNGYARLTPLPLDLAKFDLLSRTLKLLKMKNHKIILKSHPEYENEVTNKYLEKLGVEIEYEKFELLTYQAQNIIFLHPFTSLLKHALLGTNNLILFDINYPFHEFAKNILFKNCHLINCKVTKNGRVTFNKDELWKSLAEHKKKVTNFRDFY